MTCLRRGRVNGLCMFWNVQMAPITKDLREIFLKDGNSMLVDKALNGRQNTPR